MNYKHLLVGVDFSPCSADALKEAVRLAAYDNALVTAIHVIDEEVMQYLKSHTVVDETRTRDEIRSRLDHFVGLHAGDYERVEARLAEGHPFAEIIKSVNDNRPDLLLLGSRGHGDDERRLGAIASKCLRKAPLPVLLTQERQGKPFQQVVCCIDYSPTSKRAINEAIRVAKLEQARLDFLYVYASPRIYQEAGTGYVITGIEDGEDFKRLMQQNHENFLSHFEKELKGIEVTQSVVDRISIGGGIIDHLKQMKGDLLVIGTRGRTGWMKLLLGTTAEHVVHRVPCSTLAVKPEGFRFELN